MGGHLLRRLWHAGAPLFVWAAHFAFCYGLVAVQCGAGAGAPSRSVLAIATALALAACGSMLWTSRTGLYGGAGLAGWARAAGAVLALAAIAWAGVPILLLDGCR